MKNKNGSVSVRVICECHPKATSGNPFRRNKNLIRILESFVILPAIVMAGPFGGVVGAMKVNTGYPQIVLAQQETDFNGLPFLDKSASDANDTKTQILEKEAKAIDDYFIAHNMPLKGTGTKFAKEADDNDLDWRLMPAIAVRESTGGKHACKSVANSFFGWGSCKISFKSKEEAIEVLARNLGGNNPNTAQHYDSKTTKQILQKYNPPSVIPNYYGQVMAIMNAIGDQDITLADTTANS